MKIILNYLATFALLTNLFVGAGLVLSYGSVSAATDPLDKICHQPGLPTRKDAPAACQTNGNDPLTNSDGSDGIIIKVTRLVVYATGIAAVIGIIIGGFKYVFSGGDANSVNSAKNTILYSVIGLVVAVLSTFIIQFVIIKLLN